MLENLIAELLECDVESIPERTKLFKEYPDWDSLKHVMLVFGIESRYKIELTAEEIENIKSLSDIHNILLRRGIDE